LKCRTITTGSSLRLILGPLIFAVGLAGAQTEPCSLKVNAQVVDKSLNLKPVPKLKLSIRDVTSTRVIQASTGFDGTADLNLACGTYLIRSDEPLEFEGKQFKWDLKVTLTSGVASKLELSNDNAELHVVPNTDAPGRTHDSLAPLLWKHTDFEKGNLKNLSLRSDGLLTLSLHSRRLLLDTSSAYLWALAQDSKGNLYAGGGTSAKLYRIPPDGKGKVLADLHSLEIHAIAVDAKDRVYAATSPDGKIYRITGNGKPEVFYDPKQKYIWALAFDSKGDLFVATGDQGEIHRVTADGKGRVFFKTDETHVRSMAVDSSDHLIVGTDPGGLVLRVSGAGGGFVLYQLAKREVTAVAVTRDGAIYAAGVGNKQRGDAAPAGVAGGSEVYRIEPDGTSRRVWSHAQDVVYTIALDAAGRPLLGAGNKGNVYRIESPTVYTSLLTVPETQVTSLLAAGDGHLYAATGNEGKVYEIGPECEREGTLESAVFDSGVYSEWGQLTFDANLNGGQIAVVTRSGNVDQPQKYWTAWSQPITSPKGARVDSPGARFVQWKATLTASNTGQSPELKEVDLAYLARSAGAPADLNSAPFPAAPRVLPTEPTISEEVEKIRTERHAPMPPAQRSPASAPSVSGQTTMTVKNSTAYELNVFFDGPVSKRLTVEPGASQDVDLAPGTFHVAGRVAAGNVLPFYGDDTYESSAHYTYTFYLDPVGR